MNKTRVCMMAGLIAGSTILASNGAQPYIVEEGQPRAEIVVAAQPPRATALAARELQRGVRKITGAELPIVKTPTDSEMVKIYVGESPYTLKLGIRGDELKYGAYRIVSGDDSLVLIGDDRNFEPVEPWAQDRKQASSDEYRQAWDKLTGTHYWGPAHGSIWKWCTTHPSKIVDSPPVDEQVEVWAYDERGSFNAVCDFLRGLGMRWYMPGDAGEIVPAMDSIEVPKVDKTVRPDMPLLREIQYVPFNGPREIPLWLMRLGVRHRYGFNVAHGMGAVTRRDEVKREHPDWFAKYGNSPRNGPQACFSSEGLFEEMVKYTRFMFDHYDIAGISVMPEDGYTTMCQCEKCEGKDTPERGSRGRLSDHVWGFVNRVAAEIATTHPDKLIICDAYGSYWLPPLEIEKLHPNVQVGVVAGRRPRADKPEEQKEIRENLGAWMAKTDNKVFIFENYPMGAYYLPWFVPHVMADTINATKGDSLGESIWTTLRGRSGEPGFFHFPVYFTARMYWGGKDKDVDPMLDEYYRLFYGPAEEEMRAFFEYCEENWREVGKEREKADRVLELLENARRAVEPQSVYAQRIAFMDKFLNRLRKKLETIGVEPKRENVPELVLWKADGEAKIDGLLDDKLWQQVPASSGSTLKELKEGGEPAWGTRFKMAWASDGIYVAIRCEEDPDEEIVLGTTEQDDPAVYYGDNVELLLETPQHSYYQMTINPAGAVVDLDRSRHLHYDWDAQAEIATSKGKGYWIVEMFLPVFDDAIDPNHQVVGRTAPSRDNPWYFNVCRQRIRGKDVQHSAYSPTFEKAFHVLDKFAKMVGE